MSKIEHSKIQKDKILKTSFKLFCEKGYIKTTTREIADAAEINKGLLHYYYKQKEDIVYDIYDEFVRGLMDFLDIELKSKVKGLSYFALINMLYFKVATSRPKFVVILSEVLSSNALAKHKIETSMKYCLRILKKSDDPITEQQLLLAVTVTIGSESQLLSSIVQGAIKMDYEEFAVTIEKLFLTMMQIDSGKMNEVISEALEECDKINVSIVCDYLSKTIDVFRSDKSFEMDAL